MLKIVSLAPLLLLYATGCLVCVGLFALEAIIQMERTMLVIFAQQPSTAVIALIKIAQIQSCVLLVPMAIICKLHFKFVLANATLPNLQ